MKLTGSSLTYKSQYISLIFKATEGENMWHQKGPIATFSLMFNCKHGPRIHHYQDIAPNITFHIFKFAAS